MIVMIYMIVMDARKLICKVEFTRGNIFAKLLISPLPFLARSLLINFLLNCFLKYRDICNWDNLPSSTNFFAISEYFKIYVNVLIYHSLHHVVSYSYLYKNPWPKRQSRYR